MNLDHLGIPDGSSNPSHACNLSATVTAKDGQCLRCNECLYNPGQDCLHTVDG